MYCMMIIFNVLNIVIDSFVIIKESFLPLKSVWECFFKWADPPDSQNGFTVLPYIKGVTESLTRIVNNDVMGSELPPDQLRPCNRNLLLPNQDLHQIGKRTLSIKSPVRTAHGITLEKRVDAYTLEKRNTYQTLKF